MGQHYLWIRCLQTANQKDVNKMLVILEDAQKDHSHVSGEIAKPFFESKEEEK